MQSPQKGSKTTSMVPFGNGTQSDQPQGPYTRSTPTPNEQQNINGILKPSRNRGGPADNRDNMRAP
jgi:hypothetical protein